MQLYAKMVGGILTVLATHADGDPTPAAAYGPGTVILPFAGALPQGGLVGGAVPEIDLHAYAAARRYAVETAGIEVNGVRVASDLASQNRVAAAYAYVQASGVDRVKFKAASGWIELTADQVKAVALALGAHVQAAFAAEDAASAGIDGGTITTLAQIDAAFASA